MPASPPWNVRGVDPKDRTLIVAAAKLEGMLVGEWLLKVALPEARKVVTDAADPTPDTVKKAKKNGRQPG